MMSVCATVMFSSQSHQDAVNLHIEYSAKTPMGISSPQAEDFKVLPGSMVADIETAIRLMFGLADDELFLLEDSSGSKLALSQSVLGFSSNYNLLVKRKPARVASEVGFPAALSPAPVAAPLDASSTAERSSASQGAAPEFPEYPDEPRIWTVQTRRRDVRRLFHTGWATEWKKSRAKGKYRVCLGVYSCPKPECKFTKRPLTKPKRRKAECSTWTCKKHSEQVWVPRPRCLVLICMHLCSLSSSCTRCATCG